jgi:hypothetical protein
MSEPHGAEPCYLQKHGFEYDMFFSYSHGDPRGKGDSPLKRWSKQLNEALSETLDALLSPPPRIFFDESSDGLNKTAHLGPEIEQKVRASALFHMVMSPHYLNSPWCRRELDTFVENLPGQASGIGGRLFISKAMETDDLAWPSCLCDAEGNKTVGWEFHDRGSPLPHGWLQNWGGDVPAVIAPSLMELANQIARALRALDATIEEKARKTELVGWLESGDIEKVYLYGRCDEVSEWEATWKEMDDLGIVVTPSEPEPLDADDDSIKRLQYAKLASRCDAMIMVGGDGVKLDFDLDVIGRERRNFIASKYKKYLPCAVVDRTGMLNRPARLSNAKRFDIDWIDAGSCDWPDYVRTWLRSSADKVRQRYGLEARAE